MTESCANCGRQPISEATPAPADSNLAWVCYCPGCADGAADAPYSNHAYGKTAEEARTAWNVEQDRILEERLP